MIKEIRARLPRWMGRKDFLSRPISGKKNGLEEKERGLEGAHLG